MLPAVRAVRQRPLPHDGAVRGVHRGVDAGHAGARLRGQMRERLLREERDRARVRGVHRVLGGRRRAEAGGLARAEGPQARARRARDKRS